MYLTFRQRKLILYGSIAVVAIVILGVVAFMLLSDDVPSPETQLTPPQETKTTEQPDLLLEGYTQYDTTTNSCLYHYKGGECYVPRSFCVIDPDVKTPQNIDVDEYCSATPELTARSLRAEEGSVCPFAATAGDKISLKSIVEDPDADDPLNSYGPLGRLDVSFSEPFQDTNGIWQTKEGDAGVYQFTLSVTDGEYTSEQSYCIEILPGNRPPELSNLRDMMVVAGRTVTLEPVCVDPDGDDVNLRYRGSSTDKEWMVTATKETAPRDVGDHIVTVFCTDERGLPAYKSVHVIVLPVGITTSSATVYFTSVPEDVVVREGNAVILAPKASTSTDREITFTFSGWMDSATRQTDYLDAGEHEVVIMATDGISTIETTVLVTVLNVNRPPQIVGVEGEQ